MHSRGMVKCAQGSTNPVCRELLGCARHGVWCHLSTINTSESCSQGGERLAGTENNKQKQRHLKMSPAHVKKYINFVKG